MDLLRTDCPTTSIIERRKSSIIRTTLPSSTSQSSFSSAADLLGRRENIKIVLTRRIVCCMVTAILVCSSSTEWMRPVSSFLITRSTSRTNRFSFNNFNVQGRRSLSKHKLDISSKFSTKGTIMAHKSDSNYVPPKNIIVIGGGIQGCSVAYHLATSSHFPSDGKVTILESQKLASAASGKGGGFMARSWGDGSVTQRLHELAFDMYDELSTNLPLTTYRKLPVLSVNPGKGGNTSKVNRDVKQVLPSWLDGNTGSIRMMGYGDDTAQVTPNEVVTQMVSNAGDRLNVCYGTATGVELAESSDNNKQTVVGVKYKPLTKEGDASTTENELMLECDAVVISAGPWSCIAEDWFTDENLKLPMEGVKSTSIVWSPPSDIETEPVDATALFCGEDHRFGTHLEVYPRPDNTIYLCGIGGSDYISTQELKEGAFRENCPPKESRVMAAQQSFQEMSERYRLKGELQQTQACMRPCPPDALPYMGPICSDKVNGAYINAGHNCWGIAWAPACGLAMAELILEGQCHSVNLQPFDPSRFTPTPKKGGRGRKKMGMNVGEQW